MRRTALHCTGNWESAHEAQLSEHTPFRRSSLPARPPEVFLSAEEFRLSFKVDSAHRESFNEKETKYKPTNQPSTRCLVKACGGRLVGWLARSFLRVMFDRTNNFAFVQHRRKTWAIRADLVGRPTPTMSRIPSAGNTYYDKASRSHEYCPPARPSARPVERVDNFSLNFTLRSITVVLRIML